MKYFLIAALTTIALAISMEFAMGQQNYIKCQHLATGSIQMFPGMSCPAQWAPV